MSLTNTLQRASLRLAVLFMLAALAALLPAAPAAYGQSDGSALDLQGTAADYAYHDGMSNFPSTALTVTFWLKSTYNAAGIVPYASDTDANALLIYKDNDGFDIWISGNSVQPTNLYPTDGNWHHVAVTWRSSDGQVQVYVDAVKKYTDVLMTGVLGDGGYLVLGQDQDSRGGGFQASQSLLGQLDEVQIWNRVLTSAEVYEAWRNAPAGTENGLVSYYALDGSAADGAGANDLTLAGSAAYASPGAPYDEVPARLAGGTYIIGPSGDYGSFGDAATALHQTGVAGAVVFEVASGMYTEQVTLLPIPGASATNTVTFRSASGDRTDVTLTAGAAPLTLQGADHVRIEAMTVQSTNSESRAVVLADGTNDVRFTGNVLQGGASGFPSEAVLYAHGAHTDNLVITGNYFPTGASGVYLSGFSNDRSENVHIEGNRFETKNGIFVSYHNGDLVITENRITASLNGIQVSNSGAAEAPVLVANNIISSTGESSSSVGMYTRTTHALIYHNTVNIMDAEPAFEQVAGGSLTLHNNIFVSAGGWALQVGDPSGIAAADYNDLYTTGPELVSWGGTTTYADLAAYRSATGRGANAQSGDPDFVSETDLTPQASFLDDEGTDLSAVVPTDINGAPRSANPSIGAIEFTGSGVQITFQVDLRRLERLALFDPSTSAAPVVEIFGGPYAGEFRLTDGDGDGAWTVARSFDSGDAIAYAFAVDYDGNLASTADRVYELNAGAGARSLTVPAASQALPLATFDDQPIPMTPPAAEAVIMRTFESGNPSPRDFENPVAETFLSIDFSTLDRTAAVTARRYEDDPGGQAPSGIAVIASQGYWTLHQTPSQAAYSAELTVDYSRWTGIAEPQDLRLLRRPHGAGDADTWQIIATTVDEVNEVLVADNLTGFSEWTIGSVSSSNTLDKQLPAAAAGPTPADAGSAEATGVTLNWSAGAETETFDVYLWKDSDTEPGDPTFADLTTPGASTGALDGGATYNWKVVSKNFYGVTESATWSFTVQQTITVYPGDTNNDGTVDQQDVLPLGLYFGETGPPRPPDNDGVWDGEEVAVWSIPDAGYADADGDGVINQADVLPLGLYFGMSHPGGGLRASDAAGTGLTVNIPPLPVGHTFSVYLKTGEGAAFDDFLGVSAALRVPEVFQVERIGPAEELGAADRLLKFEKTDREQGRLLFAYSRRGPSEAVALNGGARVVHVRLSVVRPMRETRAIEVLSAAASTAGEGLLAHAAKLLELASPAAATTPTGFTLESNYPNPFRHATSFRFALPEPADVTLEVYDVLGRRISVLKQNAPMDKGWHQVHFDASRLAPGVYFYRMQTANHTMTRKMLLVK